MVLVAMSVSDEEDHGHDHATRRLNRRRLLLHVAERVGGLEGLRRLMVSGDGDGAPAEEAPAPADEAQAPPDEAADEAPPAPPDEWAWASSWWDAPVGEVPGPVQPLEVDIQGLPLIIRFIMSRDGLSPVIALRHDVPRRGRAEPPDHPAARRLLGRMTWVMCAQEHGGPWYDYVPRRDPLVEGPELAMWTGWTVFCHLRTMGDMNAFGLIGPHAC